MKAVSFTLLMQLLICSHALAQASGTREFGPYTLYYSVVNTTFVEPKVASTYNMVRATDRAFINIAVQLDGEPQSIRLLGRTWDLFHQQELEFQEIRESTALYYIADFSFNDKDVRFFKIEFRPDNAERSYEFKFNHTLYEQ